MILNFSNISWNLKETQKIENTLENGDVFILI